VKEIWARGGVGGKKVGGTYILRGWGYLHLRVVKPISYTHKKNNLSLFIKV
jgi:hypothetical protein